MRKASTSHEETLSRGCPNGETHQLSWYPSSVMGLEKQTLGTETSKYQEENKSIEIPVVVASESGRAHCVIVVLLDKGLGKDRHRG